MGAVFDLRPATLAIPSSPLWIRASIDKRIRLAQKAQDEQEEFARLSMRIAGSFGRDKCPL